MQCGHARNAPKEPKPSPAVKAAIVSQEHGPLVNLFLFFFPLSLLQTIAEATNFYAWEEWVESVAKTNVNGKQSSRNYFRTCDETTPGATHRVSKEQDWKYVTPGFICAWIGILLARGAHGIECPDLYWKGPHMVFQLHGYVTMPHRSYHQLW